MKRRKNAISVIIVLLSFMSFKVFADSFSSGEECFKKNNPQEAIIYFSQAITESNVNPLVYNYLGISYYQLGENKKAIDIFLQGTKVSGTDKKVLFYNAGNASFDLKDYENAERYYSLSIAADSSYDLPVLNRANARMQLDKLTNAAEDYKKYLLLCPSSSQQEEIRKVIALIEEEIEFRKNEEVRLAQEKERQRIEDERIAKELEAQQKEQERLQAEKDRIAKEQQALEEERRRKLMEDIAASLQSADSTNVSAGTDGVMEYEYENELD